MTAPINYRAGFADSPEARRRWQQSDTPLPRRARPRVEPLEDRYLPSAVPSLAAGTLSIAGSPGNDRIVVFRDLASDQLVVSNGSQSVSLQLNPSENYSGVVWLARPDGSGGTDVAVIQPGDPPVEASNTNFFSASAASATAGNLPAAQYKGGASMSGLLDGSTPLEHFMLAHGHGPPFG